jgi:hypothetical protein
MWTHDRREAGIHEYGKIAVAVWSWVVKIWDADENGVKFGNQTTPKTKLRDSLPLLLLPFIQLLGTTTVLSLNAQDIDAGRKSGNMALVSRLVNRAGYTFLALFVYKTWRLFCFHLALCGDRELAIYKLKK